MDELKHLFPQDTAVSELYRYGRPLPPIEFTVPSRGDRAAHGQKLVREIRAAEREIKEHIQGLPKRVPPRGFALDFCSDPRFKLKLESLDMRRSGIELLNSRVDKDHVMHATVFVPESKVAIFVRKFEAYIN